MQSIYVSLFLISIVEFAIGTNNTTSTPATTSYTHTTFTSSWWPWSSTSTTSCKKLDEDCEIGDCCPKFDCKNGKCCYKFGEVPENGAAGVNGQCCSNMAQNIYPTLSGKPVCCLWDSIKHRCCFNRIGIDCTEDKDCCEGLFCDRSNWKWTCEAAP